MRPLLIAVMLAFALWVWSARRESGVEYLSPDELSLLRAVAGEDVAHLDARRFLRALRSLHVRGLIRRAAPGAFELTDAGWRALRGAK